MEFVIDMLRSPDAQIDPYQWAATMMAHAYVGVAAMSFLRCRLLRVAAVYAAWELVQWAAFSAGAWDCVLDWCAVVTGACVALALHKGQNAAWAAGASLVILAAGVWVRS